MSNRIGWDDYYQDDVLEILHQPSTNTFRITSTKYLVYYKNNDYISVYPKKDILGVKDRMYTSHTSLSFQDILPNQTDLYSEIKFNKMIDRILSMKVFS